MVSIYLGNLCSKIVGETKVNGAITLGRISDENLVDAYSNALVTIGPSKQEFFG